METISPMTTVVSPTFGSPSSSTLSSILEALSEEEMKIEGDATIKTRKVTIPSSLSHSSLTIVPSPAEVCIESSLLPLSPFPHPHSCSSNC